MNDGEVGWWRMDEGSGTTTGDSSGYGNKGIITEAGWISGGNCINDSCLNFDGINDYVSIENNASLTPSLMSAFVWVNSETWDKATATSFLMKRTGGASGYFFFVLTSPKTVHIDVNNVSQSRFDTGYIPPLNQWVHLGYTYDGHNVRFYVNGVLNNTSPDYNKTYAASDSPLYIGRQSTGGYEFKGRIDDVRIYDRALSSDEVKHLYEITK
jgi:hypothetical protein